MARNQRGQHVRATDENLHERHGFPFFSIQKPALAGEW